jgi:hypothetical protein
VVLLQSIVVPSIRGGVAVMSRASSKPNRSSVAVKCVHNL